MRSRSTNTTTPVRRGLGAVTFRGGGTVNRDREGVGGQVHEGAEELVSSRRRVESPSVSKCSRDDESRGTERARGMSENRECESERRDTLDLAGGAYRACDVWRDTGSGEWSGEWGVVVGCLGARSGDWGGPACCWNCRG
jgi:hypothetical protein